MYLSLKIIHVTCALLSITGFLLRSLLMFIDSPYLRHKVVLITPHLVDTVFLLSGFSIAFWLDLALFDHAWLMTKLMLLMFYLLFVGVALSRGSTKKVRISAFLMALLTFSYMIGIALSKSPASWFALG
jgi:uncharacterized membrane protein SirB2